MSCSVTCSVYEAPLPISDFDMMALAGWTVKSSADRPVTSVENSAEKSNWVPVVDGVTDCSFTSCTGVYTAVALTSVALLGGTMSPAAASIDTVTVELQGGAQQMPRCNSVHGTASHMLSACAQCPSQQVDHTNKKKAPTVCSGRCLYLCQGPHTSGPALRAASAQRRQGCYHQAIHRLTWLHSA